MPVVRQGRGNLSDFLPSVSIDLKDVELINSHPASNMGVGGGGGPAPDVTDMLCSICFCFSKTDTRNETSGPTTLPSNTVDASDATPHPQWSFTRNWQMTEAARGASAVNVPH